MSRLFRLPFPLWFARHDLLDRRAWRSSFVIVMSILFITTIITAGAGLIWGHQHAQFEHMRTHGGFYVAAGSPNVADEITHDLLARLRENLKASVAQAHARTAPFHRDEQEWVLEGRAKQDSLDTDGDSKPGTLRIEGRTVANDDPLLNSLLDSQWLQAATDFDENRGDGILITPNFLKRIDYASNDVPSHVRIQSVEGEELVPVLGVSRYPLPGDFDYLVPESYYKTFLGIQNPQRYKSILTGVIDGECCTEEFLDQFVRKFDKELKSWHVSADIQAEKTDSNEPCWRLDVGINAPGEDLSGNIWRKIVAERLPDLIRQMGGKLDIEAFSRWDPWGSSKSASPVPTAYDQFVVYVDRPEHMKSVAYQIATLERGGENSQVSGSLYVNEELIKQAERIASKTRDAELLLLIVGVVVVVVACANMFTILWMRAQQQIAEIGMLKTMGLDRRRLRRLYVVEGAVLWFLSVIPGFLIGLAVGHAIAGDLANRYQTPFAFRLPGVLPVLLVLGCSGVLCTLIMVLATRKARRTSAYLCLFNNL